MDILSPFLTFAHPDNIVDPTLVPFSSSEPIKTNRILNAKFSFTTYLLALRLLLSYSNTTLANLHTFENKQDFKYPNPQSMTDKVPLNEN